jgi:hypothetical protein
MATTTGSSRNPWAGVATLTCSAQAGQQATSKESIGIARTTTINFMTFESYGELGRMSSIFSPTPPAWVEGTLLRGALTLRMGKQFPSDVQT